MRMVTMVRVGLTLVAVLDCGGGDGGVWSSPTMVNYFVLLH